MFSKVVIPVAGWGTRSLPVSKNIPKEMLPIYNKPVIHYIIDEALRSGIDTAVFITNKDKRVIEDYFDHNLQLEHLLETTNKIEQLREIREIAEMINIQSIRQKEQKGLGHAILCAKSLVQNEPFSIILGDDLMFGLNSGLQQLITVAKEENMPVVGVMEVPRDQIHKYGIIDAELIDKDIYQVTDMVEKPAAEDAPSNLAIMGRYVLFPDIFDYLENVKPGKDGEIQLTDALKERAKEKGMLAVKMGGIRFDAGNWADYLCANIYFGLQDEKLRYGLIDKLKQIVQFE